MLMIPGPAGYLEAALREPRRRPVPAAAVFCHPHPLHGGDMNNRVVYRAARAAARAGVAALRFNFRGVGASSGTHDDGRGECEDVRAAIRWLGSRYPGKALALAGFSFGAWVGLRVGCEDSGIEALIGLGLPLSHYDFAFMSSCRKPALVVVGGEDSFAPRLAVAGLREMLPSSAAVQVIDGADHFFAGHLDKVESVIADFLEAWKPGGDDK